MQTKPFDDQFQKAIDGALQLLKHHSFETSVKVFWDPIVSLITKGLDLLKGKLEPFQASLENLAIMILFRVTTRLGSVKLVELYEPARKILGKIREVIASRALYDAINEFLVTPPDCFGTSRPDQEMELLSHQVNFLMDIIKKKKTNPETTQELHLPIGVPALPAISKALATISTDKVEIPKFQEQQEIISMLNVQNEKKDEVQPLQPQSLPMLSEFDSQDQEYSTCLLDLEGNFGNFLDVLMVDRMAESLFEKDQEDLLDIKLFDLMIPFSLCYLKKMLGPFIFSSTKPQNQTFSYTIYSEKAFKKFQKTISKVTSDSQNDKKKNNLEPKFFEDEKLSLDDGASIYYKYLQTLTSHATLVNLKFSNPNDVQMLEKLKGVKVNMRHEIIKKQMNMQENESCLAVLLQTRKANHVQKFRYSMMKERDQNIKRMENKVTKKMSVAKQKIASQDNQLNQKRFLSFDGHEAPGKKKVKSVIISSGGQ